MEDLVALAHGHSGSGLFLLRHLELAAVKMEVLGSLVEEQREYPFLHHVLATVIVVAPEQKQILSSRVPMEVAIHEHAATGFQGFVHHGSKCVDFRCLSLRTVVLAIKVEPGQRGSSVAVNDAINVDHWHYFEYEVLTEESCLFGIANQKVNCAFHDKRGLATSRVHPGSENDSFSFGDNSGWLIKVSDEKS